MMMSKEKREMKKGDLVDAGDGANQFLHEALAHAPTTRYSLLQLNGRVDFHRIEIGETCHPRPSATLVNHKKMLPFTNVGVLKRRIDVRVAMCVKKERESVCV